MGVKLILQGEQMLNQLFTWIDNLSNYELLILGLVVYAVISLIGCVINYRFFQVVDPQDGRDKWN